MIQTTRRLLPIFILLVCTASASAQIDLGVQARQDPKQMMADQLVLLVQGALAGREMPTDDQLLRAHVLLDLAADLAPDRIEVWRMKAELAELRGDRDERRGAISKIVKLDPSDDSAQLELILDGVSRRNTVEERLELVERILDAQAARGLSRALRSRLASYAAAAAREIGDERKFARRLAQAMELDPANSDAAKMAFELARDRDDSPLYLGTAAIAWAASAPTDAQARNVLADILLREGLYAESAEQMDMGVALAAQPPTADQLQRWAMALAMAGRTDGALNLLAEVERSLQQAAAYRDANAGPEGRGAEGPGDPAALPPQLELLRLAILSVSVQPDTTRENFERLSRSLQPLIDAGDENARRELAIAAAMFGHDLGAAEGYLGDAAPDSPHRRLVRGWVALRYGRLEQARELLSPLAEAHPLAALGVALMEPDPATRASMLETIRRREPTGMAGMLAVLNLAKQGAPIEPTRVGRSLRELMRQTPSRVWSTDLSLSPWLGMRLSVEPGRLAYLEPIRGTVTLQNLAGVPLSIGPAATVPEQMLVSVQPSRAGEPMPPLLPIVVDIGRRLTLQPSERVVIDFRLDHSTLGALLGLNPSEPLAFQATAILDPRQTPQGTVRPGPAGALDSVRAIQLVHQPIIARNVEAWLDGLDSPDEAEVLRCIARLLRALAAEVPAQAGGESLRQRIADTLAQHARDFSPLQQAWAMRFLPPAERMPNAVKRVVEFAQRGDDPLTRLVYLEANVTDPTDPALTAALRETDPLIGEYARALRAALVARQEEMQRMQQEQAQMQGQAPQPAPVESR